MHFFKKSEELEHVPELLGRICLRGELDCDRQRGMEGAAGPLEGAGRQLLQLKPRGWERRPGAGAAAGRCVHVAQMTVHLSGGFSFLCKTSEK